GLRLVILNKRRAIVKPCHGFARNVIGCGFEVFARLGVESLFVLEYTLVHLVFCDDTLCETAAGGAPSNHEGDCENEEPWFNSLQLHSFFWGNSPLSYRDLQSEVRQVARRHPSPHQSP